MSSAATLPRNTTRQAEGPLHGNIARLLHRFTGTVIVLFDYAAGKPVQIDDERRAQLSRVFTEVI